MAAANAPVVALTATELDERRRAVESTLGSLRIEDMEPDDATQLILKRYAQGEIALPEANRLLDERSRSVV
jgi:hypothetical protein